MAEMGTPAVQAGGDEVAVFFREVEVVDKQHGVRVGLLGGVEHLLDEFDAAELLADAADGVVLAEDGHDDHFVDDVPHIDDALESGNVALDAVELLFQDGVVVIRHQPVRAGGVPAQRVALDAHALRLQEAGRAQAAFGGGVAFDRLKTAPIERQRAVVEQAEPFLHALLVELPVLFDVALVGFHVRGDAHVGGGQRVKRAAAEQEFVVDELVGHIGVGQRLAGRIAQTDGRTGAAVRIIRHVSFLLFDHHG